MNSQVVSIILTVEQVLNVAQAADTFISLLQKIKTSNPEAWAQVGEDYQAAVAAWQAAKPASVA